MYDHNITLYLSTSNQGKLRELVELIDLDTITAYSKAEAGFAELKVEENGATLEENALIKARALREALMTVGKDGWVIADDTGLFVDALDGAPGIYSARYAGDQHDDEDNIDKLLEELDAVSDDARGAYFETVIALISDGGEEHLFHGKLRGAIARERKGDYGFGYDSIFWLPEQNKMLAELNDTEKNEISHRGNAYRALRSYIQTL